MQRSKASAFGVITLFFSDVSAGCFSTCFSLVAYRLPLAVGRSPCTLPTGSLYVFLFLSPALTVSQLLDLDQSPGISVSLNTALVYNSDRVGAAHQRKWLAANLGRPLLQKIGLALTLASTVTPCFKRGCVPP
jgi:hypothetical protein